MNDELVQHQMDEHKEKFKDHDERLKEHDCRIDKLERENVEFRIEIKNLCDDIKDLTATMNSAMKWWIGVSVSGILGIIIFIVQQMMSR